MNARHHSIVPEKIFFDGERNGDMLGDVLQTCCECKAVTIKCLDEKIFNYVKNRLLNLIYIESARDRELEIVLPVKGAIALRKNS